MVAGGRKVEISRVASAKYICVAPVSPLQPYLEGTISVVKQSVTSSPL